MAVDLALGRHGVLIPELEALVALHPLQERLREHHMRALYGAGRRADALASYQDLRVILARELGIDPGPSVRRLLSDILADDEAALAPWPAPVPAVPSAVFPARAGNTPHRRHVRLRHPARLSSPRRR